MKKLFPYPGGLVFFDSGETDMNLWGSLPNHENRKVYEGTRSGLSEERRAGIFLDCLFLIRRRGDPSRAAAIIVKGGVGKKSLYHN